MANPQRDQDALRVTVKSPSLAAPISPAASNSSNIRSRSALSSAAGPLSRSWLVSVSCGEAGGSRRGNEHGRVRRSCRASGDRRVEPSPRHSLGAPRRAPGVSSQAWSPRFGADARPRPRRAARRSALRGPRFDRWRERWRCAGAGATSFQIRRPFLRGGGAIAENTALMLDRGQPRLQVLLHQHLRRKFAGQSFIVELVVRDLGTKQHGGLLEGGVPRPVVGGATTAAPTSSSCGCAAGGPCCGFRGRGAVARRPGG